MEIKYEPPMTSFGKKPVKEWIVKSTNGEFRIVKDKDGNEKKVSIPSFGTACIRKWREKYFIGISVRSRKDVYNRRMGVSLARRRCRKKMINIAKAFPRFFAAGFFRNIYAFEHPDIRSGIFYDLDLLVFKEKISEMIDFDDIKSFVEV